jgi:pimeloyl-ACP methyl ester carboxylesterase
MACAAAQQLGPLGEAVRGQRLRGADAEVAGRPDTVEEAKAHPEVFAHKSVGQVADHFETIIRGLNRKPAIVGHSFGGLLTQILAGRGLAAVSVAIDQAPFRGVLPLPISSLKSAFPVLGNPANRNRAVPLTHRHPPQCAVLQGGGEGAAHSGEVGWFCCSM